MKKIYVIYIRGILKIAILEKIYMIQIQMVHYNRYLAVQ